MRCRFDGWIVLRIGEHEATEDVADRIERSLAPYLTLPSIVLGASTGTRLDTAFVTSFGQLRRGPHTDQS
jgi:hypothetical protein